MNVRGTEDVELLALCCVDKLDNLKDIQEDFALAGEEVWNRFKVDKASQAWYYQSLAKLFSEKLKGSPYGVLAENWHD